MADGDGEENTLTLASRQVSMICNQSYGCFVEKLGKYRTPTGRVVGIRKLTMGNSDRALVNIYRYKSTQLADGAYVVIQFVLSRKFFYARREPSDKPNRMRLDLKEGGFDPYPVLPEKIKSPDDPRVFLMKQTNRGGSADVVFAWNGVNHYTITLFPEQGKAAQLLSEENGGDGQLFGLHLPVAQPGQTVVEVEPQEEQEHGQVLAVEFQTRLLSPLKPIDEQFGNVKTTK